MTASKHSRWVPLLGEELARRVVKLGVASPGDWCRDAVLAAVERAEGRHEHDLHSAEQAKCAHPAGDRTTNGRCKKCGMTGLPGLVVAKGAAK